MVLFFFVLFLNVACCVGRLSWTAPPRNGSGEFIFTVAAVVYDSACVNVIDGDGLCSSGVGHSVGFGCCSCGGSVVCGYWCGDASACGSLRGSCGCIDCWRSLLCCRWCS